MTYFSAWNSKQTRGANKLQVLGCVKALIAPPPRPFVTLLLQSFVRPTKNSALSSVPHLTTRRRPFPKHATHPSASRRCTKTQTASLPCCSEARGHEAVSSTWVRTLESKREPLLYRPFSAPLYATLPYIALPYTFPHKEHARTTPSQRATTLITTGLLPGHSA